MDLGLKRPHHIIDNDKGTKVILTKQIYKRKCPDFGIEVEERNGKLVMTKIEIASRASRADFRVDDVIIGMRPSSNNDPTDLQIDSWKMISSKAEFIEFCDSNEVILITVSRTKPDDLNVNSDTADSNTSLTNPNPNDKGSAQNDTGSTKNDTGSTFVYDTSRDIITMREFADTCCNRVSVYAGMDISKLKSVVFFCHSCNDGTSPGKKNLKDHYLKYHRNGTIPFNKNYTCKDSLNTWIPPAKDSSKHKVNPVNSSANPIAPHTKGWLKQERKFVCPHCGHSNVKLEDLNIHIDKRHSFPCPHCDHNSIKLKDMKMHVRSKHGSVNPVHNTITYRDMKQHMQSNHGSGKPVISDEIKNDEVMSNLTNDDEVSEWF